MANPAYQNVTTTQGKTLFSGNLTSTGSTTIYTVPASSTVKLATFTLCNTSGTARTVADGATTNASTTVTSATAGFTSADVGKAITGAGIPAGATISSVTNSTTIVLSAAATATATGVSLTWQYPAAAVVVSVAVLTSGQTVDGTHAVISGYSLAATDTLSLKDQLGGAMLAEADFIVVTVSTAKVVTVVLTGAVSS